MSLFDNLNIPGAEVAQVVEQRTENPRVGSSTLPLGTIFIIHFYDSFIFAGVAQW